MKELDNYNFQSRDWATIRSALEAELERLRDRLCDSKLPHDDTLLIRGRVSLIRDFLAAEKAASRTRPQ